jgi:chaperone LolA
LALIPRGLLAVCLWFAAAGFAADTATATATTATAETPLHAFLTGLRSLAGDFEQRVFDETGALLETSHGQLRMARPRRFAWLYREPFRQTIVSDGQQLWLYDEDLAQVTVSNVGESLAGSAAQLLGDEEDPAVHYRISPLPPRENLQWLELVPKAASSQYTRIEVGFAGAALARMRLADNLGQITELRFESLSRNPALPADSFDFRVPAGVDVVNATEP